MLSAVLSAGRRRGDGLQRSSQQRSLNVTIISAKTKGSYGPKTKGAYGPKTKGACGPKTKPPVLGRSHRTPRFRSSRTDVRTQLVCGHHAQLGPSPDSDRKLQPNVSGWQRFLRTGALWPIRRTSPSCHTLRDADPGLVLALGDRINLLAPAPTHPGPPQPSDRSGPLMRPGRLVDTKRASRSRHRPR